MEEQSANRQVQLLLRQAYERHAQNNHDGLREAYDLSCEAVKLAPDGSLESARAHMYVTVTAANLGIWMAVEESAARCLELAPCYPQIQPFQANVMMAHAYAHRAAGRLPQAAALLREALQSAEGEMTERLQLALVWVLCEAKQPTAALAELPRRVQYLPDAHRRAAYARVLAARGQWAEARQEICGITREQATVVIYDLVTIYYLWLIRKKGADAARPVAEGMFWAKQAAVVYSKWLEEIEPMPNPAQGGGEWVDRNETHPSGPRPAGYDRTGLVGVVGKG